MLFRRRHISSKPRETQEPVDDGAMPSCLLVLVPFRRCQLLLAGPKNEDRHSKPEHSRPEAGAQVEAEPMMIQLAVHFLAVDQARLGLS